MNKFQLIALSLSLSTQVFALSEEYKLLKDRRISLPEYSPNQKLLVINQAEFTFKELFVHKDLKIQNFGLAADPLPLLEKLKTKVANISDVEFHQSMIEIFSKSNDLHTTYQLPKPYACYTNFLPFDLKDSIDKNGKKVVALQVIESDPAVLALIGRELQIKVGDILTKINDTEIESVISAKLPLSFGANPDAARRRTIGNFSWVSQKKSMAPDSDFVKLKFVNSNGEEYEEVIPWVNQENVNCLKSMNVEDSADTASNEDIIERQKHFRTKKPLRKSLKVTQQDKFLIQKTEEPIITWKLINNENGLFGYLKLESFVPEKLSIDDSVKLIKKIIQTEFQNTYGLIIDVRDNGGGKIRLGENLVQLFTPKKIQPLNFLLKASQANLHFFENVSFDTEFKKILKEALDSGLDYTKAIPLSGELGMNIHGQAYDMPVAIFTNANCYSTCDMMSASMQDHGVATIFGEDTTTGAGGANNVTLSSFYNDLENKGPFVLMPEFQDIGLSWRQTIRVGKNEGKVLEDIGVLSEMIVENTMDDLRLNSAHQYLEITKMLKKQGLNRSTVDLNYSQIDVVKGSKTSIKLRSTHTDSIVLFENGVEIASLTVDQNESEDTTINLPDSSVSELGGKEIVISGYLNGKVVWKRKIYLRVTPPTRNMDNGINLDFSSAENLLLIGNDGWKVADGRLSIGNGAIYSNYTITEASLFVKLNSTSANLKFDLDLISEEHYDFFRVVIRADGKETQLEKLSGTFNEVDLEYDLSAYAGKNVEIAFKFDSDEAVNEGRVLVDNLRISP